MRSEPPDGSFTPIKVEPNDPVLESQNLHPTTQPAIPTPSTQLPTTNNQPIDLEQYTLPVSALTIPTVGASTAYGTTTSVGTVENLQEPTKTHAVFEEPTFKPPPAHQQDTIFPPTVAKKPVSLIQQPKPTIYQPVNEEEQKMGTKSDNRGMLVAHTHGTKWYQNDPVSLQDINGPVKKGVRHQLPKAR